MRSLKMYLDFCIVIFVFIIKHLITLEGLILALSVISVLHIMKHSRAFWMLCPPDPCFKDLSCLAPS